MKLKFTSFLAVSIACLFLVDGCFCTEELEFDVSYRNACEGDTIKVSWKAESGLSVSVTAKSGKSYPGLGTSVSHQGEVHVTLTETETFTIETKGKCDLKRDITVNIAKKGDILAYTAKGRWKQIYIGGNTYYVLQFEVADWKVSPTLQAVSITANFTLICEDGTTCNTPPFLDGLHVDTSYGFRIMEPFITETFTAQHPKGVWRFGLLCSCGYLMAPNSQFVGDFVLHLKCI